MNISKESNLFFKNIKDNNNMTDMLANAKKMMNICHLPLSLLRFITILSRSVFL